MPEPGFLRAVEVLTNALLTPQEFARHKPAPGQQELRWITIHSNGEGEEGRRIQINTKTGEIEKGFGAGKTMHEAFAPKSEAPAASEAQKPAEEFKSPFHGDEESRHWYGAKNRPIGHATVPRGFVETKNHDAFRHGAVAYPQPLSDKDQYDYELTPIHGDDAIPELAKKLGGEMDSYASQYADPENDSILDDFLGQEGPRKLLGHVDKDKLKAEFRKQFGQPEEEATPEPQKPNGAILSKYPSLADPPKQAEMNEMVRAAAGYQLHGMRNEPEDRAAWREHSKHMTKSAIDGWLMKKFGIDSATARAVSNAAGEMNPFTTEGAGTVGGQGVKWNHNSPEPTMEELGDMPWMKSGEAGEKGGLSKEQITKRLDELYAHPGPIGEAQEKLDSAKRDFDFEHQVHQHGGGFVVTKSDWSKGGRSSPISEVFPTKDAANQHYRELREKHLKPHDDAVKSLDSERESLLKQERAITDPAPIDLSPSVNPIQTNRESLSSMRSAMKSRIAELEAKEASETKRLTSEKSRAKGAAKKDAIDDQWRAMKDDLSKQRQAVMQSHLKEIESHPEYQQEKAESSRKAKERQASDRVEDEARASDGDKANWDHIQSNGGYEAARDSLTADIKSLKSRLAKTKDANKWKLESNLASRERDLERVNALNEKFGQKQPAALPPEIAAKYPSLAEPEPDPSKMSLSDKLAWQKANPGKGKVKSPEAKPKPKQMATASGAKYEFVKDNGDGTATVRNEQGDEFSTDPGEPWSLDAPEKSGQVSPSPERSADERKPFKPEGIPGEQMGLFDQDAGGQKSLFNVVKPDKKSKKAEPTASTLEKIGDEHKSRSEESAPLPGQKSIEDQYPSLKGYAGDRPESSGSPSDLLEKAQKYTQYGENYSRNIATSANQLQSLIDRGFSVQQIKMAADELATRLKVHGNDPQEDTNSRSQDNSEPPSSESLKSDISAIEDSIKGHDAKIAAHLRNGRSKGYWDNEEDESAYHKANGERQKAVKDLNDKKTELQKGIESTPEFQKERQDALDAARRKDNKTERNITSTTYENAMARQNREFNAKYNNRADALLPARAVGGTFNADGSVNYESFRKDRPMGEVDGHPEANKPLVGGNSQSSESAPKAKAKPAKFEMPTDEQLAGMSPKRHQAGYYLTHLDSALDDLQTARANLAKAKQPQSGYYPSTLKSAEAANKKAERAYKKEFLAAQAAKDKYEEFSRKAPHEELIHHLHEAMNHDGKCCYEKEEGEDDIADHVPADHRHMDKSVHELCRHLGASHPELQAAYENYTAAME